MTPLTDTQEEIVSLIAQGYRRSKIAEEMGMATNSVRVIIRRLCARYDCPMEDLPDVLAAKGVWRP